MQARLLIHTPLPDSSQECQKLLEPLVKNLSPQEPYWQFIDWGEKTKIASIQNIIAQSSQSGGQKLWVVVLAHFNLNSHICQNALLKFLEEPPEQVLVILLCQSLHGVLPTISSRCLLTTLDTPKPSPDLINAHPLVAACIKAKEQKLSAPQLSKKLLEIVNVQYQQERKKQKDSKLTTIAINQVLAALVQCSKNLAKKAAHESEIIKTAQLCQHWSHCLDLLHHQVSVKNAFFDLALHLL